MSQTWAIVIDDASAGALDGTDVGMLDLFIDQQEKGKGAWDPSNNPAGEEEWAEAVLGMALDLNFIGKVEAIGIFDTDQQGVRAFQTAFQGGYFIVKNATHRALYENKAEFGWGVIDITALDAGFNLGGVTISHVTEFNGPDGPPGEPEGEVPIPGTLLLLGLGLFGFGASRRV